MKLSDNFNVIKVHCTASAGEESLAHVGSDSGSGIGCNRGITSSGVDVGPVTVEVTVGR